MRDQSSRWVCISERVWNEIDPQVRREFGPAIQPHNYLGVVVERATVPARFREAVAPWPREATR